MKHEQLKFLPKKSNGGKWSFGFLASICLISILILINIGSIASIYLYILFGTLAVIISIVFIVVIHGYYTMTYLITLDELILTWSFFKKRISLIKIKSISTISSKRLEGIRVAGVGIPGNLFGKFQLKMQGKFEPIFLFITDIKNFLIIQTFSGKMFGINPEHQIEFINSLRARNIGISETQIDTEQPLCVTDESIKKIHLWLTAIYLLCVSLRGASLIYISFTYPILLDVIPLYWNVEGAVDRFGPKSEITISIRIFSRIGLFLATLGYRWLRKKVIWVSQSLEYLSCCCHFPLQSPFALFL
jgi:hypothetical protein